MEKEILSLKDLCRDQHQCLQRFLPQEGRLIVLSWEKKIMELSKRFRELKA